MKKYILTAIILLGSASLASAAPWDWTNIFGSGSGSSSSSSTTSQTSNTIGNLLEGIFSRTDISIEDMAGTWTVDGSAVAFKSEDFLSQAGGTAAAAAIQTELDPYYKKYGLDGATVTIDTDGKCNIKLKRGSISGVITRVDKGEFTFKITILGQTLSSVPLYVRKTSQTMDMMFDVAKLKQVLQLVAKLSGNSLAQTVINILDKYDGVYVGFGTKLVQSATPQQQSSGTQSSGLDALRRILNGGN